MPDRITGRELDRFLGGRHVAVLATTGRSGRAVLTPIWYLYRGGKLLMRTGNNSAKARNIRREPRVSVCVQDERAPYKSVTVYGAAELQAEVKGLDVQVARHYLGYAGAIGYLRSARETIEADGGEVTIVVTPERVASQDFSAETPGYARPWLLLKRILPPQI